MFADRSCRMFAIALAVSSVSLHSVALQLPATQQICYQASVPLQQTYWSTSIPIPKFDPALGNLQQIDIQFNMSASGSIQIESLDASPTVFFVYFGCTASLLRPNMSVIDTISPSASYNLSLAQFDGTLDFAGASGTSISPTATATDNLVSPPPTSDLIDFTGPAGNPGTILLSAAAVNSSAVFGPGNFAFIASVQASVSVQVCYTYLPSSTGSTYCFGDGSSLACPCGNFGSSGNGCASSVNSAGANLTASGIPSISADSFALQGAGMPNSAALYYQGTTQIDGYFGDGKRCVGGSIVRIGTKLNIGGMSRYPVGADTLISLRGMNSAGAIRTYQVWYRNAAPYCTPSTFNLTNGLKVTWVP